MTQPDQTAIYCWIIPCPWWTNEPADRRLSGPQRDDLRVEHMLAKHTVREIHDEIMVRLGELGPEPHNHFTREQIEDRNSVLHELTKTMQTAMTP